MKEEERELIYNARIDGIHILSQKQFLLSYLANVSKEDSDNMTIIEIDKWLDLLAEQLEKENKNK